MQYCLPRSSMRTRSGSRTLASSALTDGVDRAAFVAVLTGDCSILSAMATTAMKATNSRKILAATALSPDQSTEPALRTAHCSAVMLTTMRTRLGDLATATWFSLRRGARRRPISSAETRSRLGRRMNRDRINQRGIIAVPQFIHPSRYRPHAQRIVGRRLQQLIPGPRAGKPTFGALSVQHSRGIRSWIAPMNELASVIIIVQVVSVSSFAPFGPEASC